MHRKDEELPSLSRRSVIVGAALVPVATLASAAQPAAPAAFAPSEQKTLEAFVDRLIPSDDLGPGAVECGVVSYIGQALAGPLAEEKTGLLQGLAAVDSFSRTTHGAPFAELAPEKQDAVLSAMESGAAGGFPNARAVFTRIRRLTLEGMFSDPHYGGNKNFAGWDLIRYPGPRLAVSPDDQKMKVEIQPYRRSAWGANGGH